MSDAPASSILSGRGLTMAFGGADVLRAVDVDLRAGEIHGLVGENGAGKSTLAKILAGVHQPRAGRILLDGHATRVPSTHAAAAMGIALIHQEPLTFPDLTVAENIFLGRQPTRRGAIRWRDMQREAGALLASLGASIDPRRRVRGLSIADQQMIEMAAALSREAHVYLFDETTAALTPTEAGRLFAVMRRLRDGGAALAFIGHRMEEIFAVCDRLTVLRDGDKVGERLVAETSVDEVLRLMVGREVDLLHQRGDAGAPGELLLRVEGLCGARFRDISFSVRAGEIVGLAGLVGAGRSEVARAIMGIDERRSGRVELAAREVAFRSPREALRAGIAYLPEDRQHQGVLAPMSITANTTTSVLPRFARLGWLRRGEERRAAAESAREMAVRCRGVRQPIRELSGGNQQKVLIARQLLARPRLLILDEPTRGIDIGAKVEIHRLMARLASEGMGILMISSDLPEVLAMSDRIVVLREGRMAAQMDAADATQEHVIAAAAGAGGAS